MLKAALKKYCYHLHFFYRSLRWRVAATIALSLCVGSLDGLGLAMFVPLLGMSEATDQVNSTSHMGVLGTFVRLLSVFGVELTLISVLLVMLTLFVLKGLAQFFDYYYRVFLRTQFMADLRVSITQGLADMSYERFVTFNGGEIHNVLSAEITRTANAFNQYFAALQSTILLIVYIVLATFANPGFSALVLVGVGITNVGYRWIYRRTTRLSRHLSNKGHWYHSLLIQSVHLFKYLKATSQTGALRERLMAGIKEMEATQLRMGFLHAVVVGFREPLVVLTIVVVILLNVTLFGSSVSAVLLSVVFFYRALTALMTMQTQYSGFLQASGALESISAFQQKLTSAKERLGGRPYPGIRSDIVLQDVSFRYVGGKPVLENVSLRIYVNEAVAVVGESGSGKTTLVNLIAGLLRPSSGQVRVDDTDLQEYSRDEYRRTIGYISQEPVVFSDTVFNNVTFWAPKNEASLRRFWKACESAAVRECIEALPSREDTRLGDNGVMLSGGQRQRISIARELYRSPEILILDEATSALDSETELTIQENIELLRGRCTMIIVAHRLSTIKSADRIVVLERGHLTGHDSFRGLLQDSRVFERMVELQRFEM